MDAMKNRIGVIVLAVVCLGLAIALVLQGNKASDRQHHDADTIGTFSNNLAATSAKLDEQRQVDANLNKDLEEQKKAYAELTNQFTKSTADLSATASNLTQTQTALKASQDEVVKRDAKIADLEAQNLALDKHAGELSDAITNLNAQITATQKKLNAAEGDKAFLQKELKRLIAEKTELERQFNDLAVLRAQVSRLKEEMSIARRLEWIRKGIFSNNERKGAQQLMQGAFSSSQTQPPRKTPKPAYDLNVEVRSDGSLRVLPPETNAPAAK